MYFEMLRLKLPIHLVICFKSSSSCSDLKFPFEIRTNTGDYRKMEGSQGLPQFYKFHGETVCVEDGRVMAQDKGVLRDFRAKAIVPLQSPLPPEYTRKYTRMRTIIKQLKHPHSSFFEILKYIRKT